MKISTGTLAFNVLSTIGEKLFTAQLEHLYNLSDEILITEGATKVTSNHYWDGDTSWATHDGHSTDKTIEFIKDYPDPDRKITLITKEGFWNGKTEMCNTWAEKATGDYLWQIDSDEFYKEEDIVKIKYILENFHPTAVHFYANHFFGGFNTVINETGRFWGNHIPWMRIFKHSPGKSHWISHEPPNYVCEGKICNEDILVSRDETLKWDIKMYHYSYVYKSQFEFKTKFYKQKEYMEYWDKMEQGETVSPFNDTLNNFNPQDHPEIIKKYVLS
jgi:glycosyltransferase involved in cell wall biosynthesis